MVPDKELRELLDLAELAMRTMPGTARNIERRNRRGRLLRRTGDLQSLAKR